MMQTWFQNQFRHKRLRLVAGVVLVIIVAGLCLFNVWKRDTISRRVYCIGLRLGTTNAFQDTEALDPDTMRRVFELFVSQRTRYAGIRQDPNLADLGKRISEMPVGSREEMFKRFELGYNSGYEDVVRSKSSYIESAYLRARDWVCCPSD